MSGSPDSVDLVRRAQAGDMGALGLVFERYHRRVRRIVRLRLPPRLRRRYDSLDIVDETFVIAIEKFDRFELRSESSLINWLAKIAENCIRNRTARKSVWVQNALESLEAATADGRFELQGGDEPPDELAAGNEERERVDACLRGLREQHREVLLLRHFTSAPGPGAEMPWRLVGEELGVSEDAARMLHSRARVALAKCLQRTS